VKKGLYSLCTFITGCISEGDTIEEAVDNIIEAIELYLEPIEDDTIALNDVIIKEINLWARFPPCLILK